MKKKKIKTTPLKKIMAQTNQTKKAPIRDTRKIQVVFAPLKKWKVIRSNKQVLSEIAQNLKIYSEAQRKRHQKSLPDDKKCEDWLLWFKREEVKKDRLHEMRIAEMFNAAMQI